MRIAYLSPYKGPHLLKTRPTLRNLSLAVNVKIEVTSELLLSRGHEVEVISQGEIIDNHFKYYPPLEEPQSFNPNVPVYYASALPIRRVNGFWSNWRTLELFKARHRAKPFDVAMLYNLKTPQVICGHHAVDQMKLPLVLDYEDDAFVDYWGKEATGRHVRPMQELIKKSRACFAVSPFLLTRIPDSIPKLLLRGVVTDQFAKVAKRPMAERKNWVAFSGTHHRTKGMEPMIDAWKTMNVPGWELRIAGHGQMTDALKQRAAGCDSIVFLGMLSRAENVQFLGEAKIGINPHDLSEVPGNLFAFKMIEYLAAGQHVITTPMGALEPELEAGITYIPDNKPQTIADALTHAIKNQDYHRIAADATNERYGPEGASKALDCLLKQACNGKN